MNTSQSLAENFFKLLIPVAESTLLDTETIELGGKLWTLVGFEQLSDAPPYTCVSYSWGTGRIVNVLKNDKISDRTIPVIEAVINSFQLPECQNTQVRSFNFSETNFNKKLALSRKASEAIWIDALCSPQEQSALEKYVQNMGEIYRASTQVFVVLNDSCFNAVHKIYNKEPLELNDYLAIASDDWIDRVWTYQEFANSKMMFLTAEGKEGTFISDINFLNALMTYEVVCRDIKDIKLTQKLDRWQLLVAAQQLVEQSAFQIMSAMNRRICLPDRPEDRINAMISVFSDANIDIQERSSIHPSEYFMQVCEKNNDYSFIFSINPRSEILGRKWRPLDNYITSVIADVAIYGSGLSGVLKDTHLQMNNMCRMIPWKSNSVVNAIENLLAADFPKELFDKLTQRGFTGCGDCIKLEHGYFFPQSAHKRSKDLFVAVSHDIKFHLGAPGLLLRSNDTDISQFCDTGVFIGKPPAMSETINVS